MRAGVALGLVPGAMLDGGRGHAASRVVPEEGGVVGLCSPPLPPPSSHWACSVGEVRAEGVCLGGLLAERVGLGGVLGEEVGLSGVAGLSDPP